jgi:hypothetical protein
MAFELSTLARAKADGTNIEPVLVLEIDDIDPICGIGTINRYIRIGDAGLLIDGSWTIGGLAAVAEQIDAISFDGTTTTISQQLMQDKGGTSSISSIAISLIDENGQITEIISPGFTVPDVLGRKARVYLGFQDTAFPEDYFEIFAGVIDEVSAGGTIIINVAHPETKKRAEILNKVDTNLNGAINAAVTSLTLNDVSALELPADSGTLECYLRIDDEVIKYTAFNTTTKVVSGCTRGALGTTAATHADDASVSSIYRLQGSAIDLSLKLMLSGGEDYYATAIDVGHVMRVDPLTDVDNAIVFSGIDVAARYGIVAGDFITVAGASNGANNFTLRTITAIETTDEGSYVVVDGAALVREVDSAAVASFKSQYNVLGVGAAMGGDEVDVAEFQRIEDFIASSQFDYDFYLKDTVTLKEFIDTDLLFPSGMFSLPRKGRVSLGLTAPPLALASLPRLTASNVTDPNKARLRRTINKYFYNAVVYKYNEDLLEDRLLSGYITTDEDSRDQIRVGSKALTIEARGVRPSAANDAILRLNSLRFLDRYRFAAEELKTSVQYGTGVSMEVGDVVLYGDPDLQMPDTKSGSRSFVPRLFEIVNKSLNIKTGRVDLTLVDTNYLSSGRYGIFGPSSKTGAGSTATQLVIKQSYSTEAGELEKSKWADYIGQAILIHDNAWTTQYESVLRGFSSSNPNIMLIDSIGASVAEDWIIELPAYPTGTDSSVNEVQKNIHCFFDPSLAVTAGSSGTSFTVSTADAAKVLVGATVLLRNSDWSTISSEVKVATVNTGTGVITVDEDLGFTPTTDYSVELVGFPDSGAAYRWI